MLGRSRPGSGAIAGFALASAGVALMGARTTARSLSPWYEELNKPPFQPPGWIFAPVWSVLYALITISAWRVFRGPRSRARRRALRLWAVQLGLNGLWTWLFFGMRKPRAGLADLGLLLTASGAYAVEARKVDPWAGRLFVPYLGWLGFAALLNEEILRRNPPPVGRSSVPGRSAETLHRRLRAAH